MKLLFLILAVISPLLIGLTNWANCRADIVAISVTSSAMYLVLLFCSCVTIFSVSPLGKFFVVRLFASVTLPALFVAKPNGNLPFSAFAYGSIIVAFVVLAILLCLQKELEAVSGKYIGQSLREFGVSTASPTARGIYALAFNILTLLMYWVWLRNGIEFCSK